MNLFVESRKHRSARLDFLSMKNMRSSDDLPAVDCLSKPEPKVFISWALYNDVECRFSGISASFALC